MPSDASNPAPAPPSSACGSTPTTRPSMPAAASSSPSKWPTLPCSGLKRGVRSRVGLTAGKVLGGAVERNRIKRRMREAVRMHLGELHLPLDVILHPRRSVLTLEFSAIEKEVRQIFRSVQSAAAKGALPAPQASGNGETQPWLSSKAKPAPVAPHCAWAFSSTKRSSRRCCTAFCSLAGPLTGGCRFQPTCSEYAYIAIDRYGLLRGGWLATRRLLRCHPFARAGWTTCRRTNAIA